MKSPIANSVERTAYGVQRIPARRDSSLSLSAIRYTLFALLVLGSLAVSALADRPNILVILFDDLGYSDLGCYGGEIETPNIDSLAKGGVRFESFYNSTRCCPSRASLMTGLYPPQAGIASFTTRNPHKTNGPAYLGRLNNRCVTLAEVLKPAGYGCYYVGKWHMHDKTGPTQRGFDNTLIMILSDNGACYEWGPFGFDGTSRRGITHLHTGDELQKMGGPGTYHSYGSGWSNLGNTPLRLYKHFTHEGGACTPFIAHWPEGIKSRGAWVRERGHLIDVMPTLRAAAGADYPKTLADNAIWPEEGVDLLGVFNDKSLPERPIYFEHQDARALIRGDWKLVLSKRMPWEIDWELYNLRKDRCETTDLADQHPERVRQLADEWLAYARRVQLYPFYLSK